MYIYIDWNISIYIVIYIYIVGSIYIVIYGYIWINRQQKKVLCMVDFRHCKNVRKLLFVNHQSSNCFRQESPMDDKISGQKYGEKQIIHKVSARYKLMIRKNSHSTVEESGSH